MIALTHTEADWLVAHGAHQDNVRVIAIGPLNDPHASAEPARRLPLGIVGTARVLVGEHPDATVVPDAAVLRDDVTGVARVALVTQNGIRPTSK